MTSFSEFSEEEPWEADIGAMLHGLPMIDPPVGFIDSALDHRPKYAGRSVAMLCVLSLLAVGAAILTGAAGRTTVTPQIDELANRHTTVQAGILGQTSGEVDYRIDTPVEMPDGFERTRNLAAEDIRQAFYASGETSVSVFVQDGPVRWDALPQDGMTEVDGLQAWVDDARKIVVVEASNNTVTIVGLPVGAVGEVLETVPRTEPSLVDRTQDLVESLVGQFGYPRLS